RCQPSRTGSMGASGDPSQASCANVRFPRHDTWTMTAMRDSVTVVRFSEAQREQPRHMKKGIFQMSVSLDGYVEGPNREIDWHFVHDEFNAYAVEMLKATDTLIMGRRTYELM